MAKRTIEIDDTLQEIIDRVIEELRDLFIEFLEDNPDTEEMPVLFDDLDYSGRFHEIIDGAVPIYTGEISDLFYLYGDDFEEAFDNAGIGEKTDDSWPMGWKPAAIYCYLEQEAADWYRINADELFDEWIENKQK